MRFPTPYEVVTEAYQPGGLDPFRNPVDAWAPPVVQRVIGWAPPASSEPIAGQDRVIVDLELLAPPEFTAGPKDRITINGQAFTVVGHPQTTEGNPFLWNPGMVVNLQRIEG